MSGNRPRTIAYLALSLDGYIADRSGGVDWLHQVDNPEDSDFGFAEFMTGIDAMLMGANTFRAVEGFGVWPYQVPVYVLSNSITSAPAGYEQRIELVSGEFGSVLTQIRSAGAGTVYVDGGVVVRGLLDAGLLDEIVLTRIPVLLGGGVSLFGTAEELRWFEHVGTEVVGPGLVKSRYRAP